MAKSSTHYTLYEVCDSAFQSISCMMGSKTEALKDLRRIRRRRLTFEDDLRQILDQLVDQVAFDQSGVTRSLPVRSFNEHLVYRPPLYRRGCPRAGEQAFGFRRVLPDRSGDVRQG